MKLLFKQIGGTYQKENGYLIPDLTLPTVKRKLPDSAKRRHSHKAAPPFCIIFRCHTSAKTMDFYLLIAVVHSVAQCHKIIT